VVVNLLRSFIVVSPDLHCDSCDGRAFVCSLSLNTYIANE
jgi:hypothetical protein